MRGCIGILDKVVHGSTEACVAGGGESREVSKVSWTVVEGDPKDPFSFAATRG